MRRIAHNSVIRLSMRGLITSAGSFGKAKKPKVACQFLSKIITGLGKTILEKVNDKIITTIGKICTFITWSLVSIVSLGSTETKVVQALNARACKYPHSEGENDQTFCLAQRT